ncbi:MAG: sialate O-acetylesterase [Prevotella sp.]|nr:sialate O-acetylesterase [Prevotella sp.]
MKKVFLLVACLYASVSMFALNMPQVFSDNLMLQQRTSARLWGWALEGSVVNVVTGWDGKEYTTTADKTSGRWEVLVSTPAASYETYSINIKGDGEERVINNVLIGEVWFCCGQSNMEMPLMGFWNCPVEGANEAIAGAGKYRNAIRVATIPKTRATEPQSDVECRWDVSQPANAPLFSAVGYFFARTLTDILDVPVGIINCSWGGSAVEGWMPKEILLTYPDGLTPQDDEDYHEKMVMYNGMLFPLAGYTVRGFLWNQGESNVGKPEEYIERFSAMVRHWRFIWRQGDDKLPIYSVELPPYAYGDGPDGLTGPDFRVAQHKITKVLENSGCVATSDLVYDYETNQVHGCRKQEIGQRLAYMAATRDYGVGGIVADAPEFEYMTVDEASAEDNNVIAGTIVAEPKANGQVLQLYFTNAQDGFDRTVNIPDFEACDSQGNWHKAIVWASSAWQNVERQGAFLKLACPEADRITAVRYCYKNFLRGKLHNLRGLPLVPFVAQVPGE